MSVRHDEPKNEEPNDQPDAAKNQSAEPRTERRKRDVMIAVLSTVVLGVLFFVALGFAFHYYGKNPTYALWWGVISGILVIIGVGLLIQQFVIGTKPQERPSPPMLQRAVMSFVRTDMPREFSSEESVETVFWFKNTGDITARDVNVSDGELLTIAPDYSICNRVRATYGPRDIGRGEEYNVRAVLSGFIFPTFIIQMRGNLTYIASTDVYGTPIRDSVPFCQESRPVGADGKVRWLSCTHKPYPKCEKYEDTANPK
jgi:hypothetical protein